MRGATVILLAFAAIAGAAELPDGRWEGHAQVPGRPLRVVLDLDRSDGIASGAISLPDLGVRGAPLADVAFSNGELTCSIKGALANQRHGPAKVKAHLKEDGSLAGEFAQGGNTAPLTLVRAGAAQIEPPPKSTSVAREIEGEWKGEYELFGYPRKLTLKFQNRGPEGAAADFVIMGKKENILPVDLVTQEGSFLSVTSSETGLSFEGRIEGGQLVGTILQGPLEIPVTLQREK